MYGWNICRKVTQNGLVNLKSTGLFSPGTTLGGGCFPPPSVKLDTDILES